MQTPLLLLLGLSLLLNACQPKSLTTSGKQIITNTIGQELMLIPDGNFQMGSPGTEPGRYDDEGPQHRVEITQPFYMSRTEVTQAQWKLVMKTEPWQDQTFAQQADHYPASYIAWDDAMEFCRRLSELEGQTYRLPTEAEWEYACRAGTTTTFCCGDDHSQLGEYSWFHGNTWSSDEKYPHPAGQKRPNAFGLQDMHGNVWEWCADFYEKNYYASSPLRDPAGPRSGSARVLRGGSWDNVPHGVRCGLRFGSTPDARGNNYGFRLVLE